VKGVRASAAPFVFSAVELRGIYAILDPTATDDPLAFLEAVLDGGVRLVQYRAKAGVERALVRRLHARTQARGALLIVNDDLDAALAADGFHAGQEDLQRVDATTLRVRLGNRVLGISCGLPGEARAAQALGADYIGTGPFAPTASKSDAGEAIGALGLRAVVAATALPVAAIGGIELADLELVGACGARMAAVISALARGPDVRANARALVERWNALSA
jgi:thiamine-phosphate pyrophosphorylase